MGGASRMCDAAHWDSWADCWEMMKNRHPHIADAIWRGLASRTPGYLSAVQESGDRLRDIGVEVPSGENLAEGLRPEDVDMEPEPSQPNHGWQKFASVTIQTFHRGSVVWPTISLAEHAMVRSQSGPFASVPFTAMPTSRVTRIASEPFRVLLLRRLRSPLPLFDVLATTAQLAAQEGRWEEGGSRPKALWRRFVGKEEPGCLSTQCCGTSTLSRTDGRRLEVVAEGLTLNGRCHLALDDTVVTNAWRRFPPKKGRGWCGTAGGQEA